MFYVRDLCDLCRLGGEHGLPGAGDAVVPPRHGQLIGRRGDGPSWSLQRTLRWQGSGEHSQLADSESPISRLSISDNNSETYAVAEVRRVQSR